jgi:hypothetical protein
VAYFKVVSQYSSGGTEIKFHQDYLSALLQLIYLFYNRENSLNSRIICLDCPN